MDRKEEKSSRHSFSYNYRLLYNHLDTEHTLATFHTLKSIETPLEEISFNSEDDTIATIDSKALDHPSGGCIYRFHLDFKLEQTLKRWLQKIDAFDVLFFKSIYIPEKIPQGYEIRAKIVGCV